jgi:nucleotide-binding universal stress UspA family protein
MTFESVQRIGAEASVLVPRMRTDSKSPKRILCATDLSQRSQRAVTRATLLANQLDAQLTLLHVAEADQSVDSGLAMRDRLEQQLASTRILPRHAAAVLVRTGTYVEGIASVAKEIDADIILLGAQRRKPLEPLIGTTAERVIALSGRPALIVNLNPRVRYGAVVIAAELSDTFMRVLRVASSLKFLEAETVSIVHGFESPYRGPLYAEGFDVHAAKRNMEAWEKAARARLLLNLDVAGVESSRFRIIFQQTRPVRAIQRVVRSVQPDLLIVGTKDRSIFNRVVRGSVANDALRTIECDILVAARGREAAGLLH